MERMEKLEALVRRAIVNGFEIADCPPDIEHIDHNLSITLTYWLDIVDDGLPDEARTSDTWQSKELIFNHDFARALFGEELIDDYEPNGHNPRIGHGGQVVKTLAWQYHLQQAVISKDPIGYMYQACFKE